MSDESDMGIMQRLRTGIGLWLLGERQSIKIVEYQGSTALSIQNDSHPELQHIFYVKKWGKDGADDVIERLEGNEYRNIGEVLD